MSATGEGQGDAATSRPPLRTLCAVLLSAVSGGLVGLAFPYPGAAFLAWFGAAPFLYALLRAHRPRRAALCGFVFGFVLWVKTFLFLAIFGRLAVVLAGALGGVHTMVTALAIYMLVTRRPAPWRAVALAPALWVVGEWLRSLGPLGVSWADLGYSQMCSLAMIQITSVIGAFGLSYLVAVTNVALAHLLLHGWSRPLVAIAAAPPIVCIAFGTVALARHPESDVGSEGVPVTVIEAPSVNTPLRSGPRPGPAAQVSVFGGYTGSPEVPAGGLVVWPESAVGWDVIDTAVLRRGVAAIAQRKPTYLLFGFNEEDEQGRDYNSAVVFGPDGEPTGVHRKTKLLVMGEQVPQVLRELLGPLLKQYGVPEHDTTPGHGFHAIRAGEFRVAPLICYESLFSRPARISVAKGANLIVIVTNDGWFGPSAAGVIHARLAAVRAVENRTPVARAACTGCSQFVDSYGRITQPTGLMNTKDRIITTHIAPDRAGTPGSIYTRLGDVILWLSSALVALALVTEIAGCIRRRRCPEGPTTLA